METINWKEKANEILHKNVSIEDETIDLYDESILDVMTAMIEFAKLACIEQKKLCAENATVEVIDHEELFVSSLPGYERDGKEVILPIYGTDTDSILDSPIVNFD